MKRTLNTILFIIICLPLFSQIKYFGDQRFTAADTLRGMLRAERNCYDVTHYNLQIKVDIDKKFISGYNEIEYRALEDFSRLQIDLFKNMTINKIIFEGKNLEYERVHNAVFVDFPQQKKGTKGSFSVHYEGNPRAAKNAPWDGGFSWKKDRKGNPWVGVSCEGIGASLWFPNKDHLSDEPDSVRIGVAVPNGLTCVANGNLESTQTEDDYTRFNWKVSYPINNYNITLNITEYAHFSDTYKSEDGELLDLDYYVLPENLSKAQKHFEQVKPMLACYEKLFGKYPFWNDGFALVETPYLGMEHQGAIAYGNQYMRGYLGGMMPSGINFDYIIIHETGHEYWGNSVSCADHAEMWIHESFCTYSEALYVECLYGFDEAVRYLNYQNRFIDNRKPIVGPLNVNFEAWGSSDHYYKGAWMLHTLRGALDDDKKWFGLLKAIHKKFEKSVTNTPEIISFINEFTGKNFDKFFEQYLYHPSIPRLMYRIKEDGDNLKISAIWKTEVEGFDMPIKVGTPDNYQMIYPTNERQDFIIKNIRLEDFRIGTELFLVETVRIEH
ncbi:MAG: M1 family metallopeptidase [Bacteroidota bacterium]